MDKDKQSMPEQDSSITPEERAMMDAAFNGDQPARSGVPPPSPLDNTDEDGAPLNESVDRSGEDLDIPGAEADDENESIGEEDEENNAYSDADTD